MMISEMEFGERFESLLADMKLDARYRTFIELERIAGEFPTALWHGPNGQSRRVTVRCSNDYLGMGQHPDVLEAMHRAIDHSGAGGTRNISGTNRQHVQLETELSDLHGEEAPLSSPQATRKHFVHFNAALRHAADHSPIAAKRHKVGQYPPSNRARMPVHITVRGWYRGRLCQIEGRDADNQRSGRHPSIPSHPGERRVVSERHRRERKTRTWVTYLT
jgi:hypothetical protein